MAAAEGCARVHWQEALPVSLFRGKRMRGILIEIEGEGYWLVSADAKGLHGEGETVEECKRDFTRAVECRIREQKGGVYVGISSDAYHRQEWEETLLPHWKQDGIVVIRTEMVDVCLFSS